VTWTQNYTPVGGIALSALVSALPIVLLLGLLGFLHVRAHLAALAGLAAAFLIAVVVYRMPPGLAIASAGYGAAFGLFPIGWIVLSAVFVYDVTVTTGKFEIVKESVARLAADRRIQVLLIAFSFGAFIEGAAGFGTPVAITAAMLIGLGFKPLPAAGLSLIGNTAPVAFGALGTPIITLAKITGLPQNELSAMVGRQLPVFSLIVPFWLVGTMAGRRGIAEVWPACLVCGGSFAVVQYFVSNHMGPTLVDIAGSAASIAALMLLLRFWQPANTWRFPGEDDLAAASPEGVEQGPAPHHSARETWIAWMPWLLLSVLLLLWGVPQIKTALDGLSTLKIEVPLLHHAVIRVPPVVPQPKPEEAVFNLNWLSASGTGLLLTGVLSGLLLGLSPAALLRVFWGTVLRVRLSLLTIAAMLALGFTSRYGGLDTTLGLAFASTGGLFVFFSPLLGWLGVALTGSDTSSNVLFGGLQVVTAQQLGLPPVLLAAANSSGGVMGKMIDAQSIVVASVATGQKRGEGEILRYVFRHSIILAALVGVWVLLQAYLFPWMVP
jgi:lactate permease